MKIEGKTTENYVINLANFQLFYVTFERQISQTDMID